MPLLALFHPPLPKLCRLVSEHTAFQRGHIIALGISKDLRIVRPCNPSSSDVFLLPPFALRPYFPISLVGRDSHDSFWRLCHLAARAVEVIPWYVVVVRASSPLAPRLLP